MLKEKFTNSIVAKEALYKCGIIIGKLGKVSH